MNTSKIKSIPSQATSLNNAISRKEAMNALEDMFDQAAGASEMTQEEIDAEIRAIRTERHSI